MTIEQIAFVCHEANRVYCESMGDNSALPWEQAKESAIKGVQFRIDNPEASAEDQHNQWCSHKYAEGWNHGEVKDAEAKTHPCLIPYFQLPEFQRRKDSLFQAIVDALK